MHGCGILYCRDKKPAKCKTNSFCPVMKGAGPAATMIALDSGSAIDYISCYKDSN